jgi:hypothetical protein
MAKPITLMDRTNAGWRVELRLTDSGPAITLQRGEGATIEGALVPADRAMDAFWHPCCYLPTPEPAEETCSDIVERIEAYGSNDDHNVRV